MSKQTIAVLLVIGAIIGGAGVEYWRNRATPAADAQGAGNLAADVAHLNAIIPSQSHAMQDVGNHFASLWFAAQHKNWPLAQFFFNETVSHVRWTVTIRPTRRHPDGSTVDVKAIFDAINVSVFAGLKLAVESQDQAEFEAAYKMTIEACYSCHKSSGLPQLRPQIPTAIPSTILNLDPAATWPE